MSDMYPSPSLTPVPVPTPTPSIPTLEPGRHYDCPTVDGDPDQLRTVARVWRAAADELQSQVQVLDANVWFWSASWNGQGKQRFADVWVSQFAGHYSTNKHTSYSDPANWVCPSPFDPATGRPRVFVSSEPIFEACIAGFRQMAQHLEDYATAIERARQEQVDRMLAIGAAVVVSVAVGLVTFGVGELIIGPAADALLAAGEVAEDSLAWSVTTIRASMTVSVWAGFASGMAGDVTLQFFENLIVTRAPDTAWNRINWYEAATAGVEGGMTGLAAYGVGAAIGGVLGRGGTVQSVGTTITVGSLTGLTISIGSQLLSSGHVDLGQTALDTALGGVTAGVFHESPETRWLSFPTTDGRTVNFGVRPTGRGTFDVIDPQGTVLGQGLTAEQGFTARLTFDGAPLTLAYDGQTGAVTFGSLDPGGRALTFSPVEVGTGQLPDGTPTSAIRYEPTGGIQTDLAGGRIFFDANRNISKTVSPEDIITSYRDSQPVSTTFSGGTPVSGQNTVDSVPPEWTPGLDRAGPCATRSRPLPPESTRLPET